MNDGIPVGSRGGNLAPWPSTWDARINGWARGLAFRVDWGPRALGPGTAPAGSPGPLITTDRGVLSHPALIGPNRAGQLMAFSTNAVNQARAAWESCGMNRVYAPAWHMSWLNDLTLEGAQGFLAPWGIAGLDVVDCGQFWAVFCPEILGPLGRIARGQGWSKAGFEASPGLEVRFVDSGILVRGAALLDGWWRHGTIEPYRGADGWMFVPIRSSTEEVWQ